MKTYILGDIHGEYDILIQLLKKVNLIEFDEDMFPHWKHNCNDVLIQVGDVLDGNTGATSCYTLLKRLQEEAEIVGGKVVRIIGNHELGYISPIYCTGANKRTKVLLQEIIKQDVLSGKLIACYLWNGYIITHAGITDDCDTSEKCDKQFNKDLVEAVQYNDFKHSWIFNVGISRNGTYHTPGIFWLDYYKDTFKNIKQIVGHTSIGFINISSNIINVDCGISRHAQKVYEILKYENNKFEVVKL